MQNKGQVTIFVIIALAVVGAIVLVVTFRDSLFSGGAIDPELAPVYSTYSACIDALTRRGIEVMGVQGGRIALEDYVPGSEFAPFSSHLLFLGNPVPYWSYVTGNNIYIENVPTQGEIERELGNYITQEIETCDLTSYYQQGFYITLDETPQAEVRISDEQVEVTLESTVSVTRGEKSARKETHEITVASRLGTLYEIALDIYEKEEQELFLELYAVDVLYNYVPVDGVLVQCSPEIWNVRDEVATLHEALASNLGAIKIRGSTYVLDEATDEYFVVDLGRSIDAGVSVLYSPQWPSVTEVTPGEDELLIAEPVGTQEGLGAMGFCYVPYHFVWDVKFPVMIQVSAGGELFQFPLAVIIDNNVPREAVLMSLVDRPVIDACEYYSGEIEVRVFDSQFTPVVGADISYKCFDSVCPLGTTTLVGGEAVYDGGIPQCVNGELTVRADGYADRTQTYSSNEDGFVDVILEKEYELPVAVTVNGQAITGNAFVTFDDGEKTVTAVLPEIDTVTLHEGEYSVSAYVYGDSQVVLPATTRRQCVEASAGGIGGFFGQTKEECIDITIPAMNIEYALRGGGQTTTFILEEDLEQGQIMVDVEGFPTPTTLEQLQLNYATFEGGYVAVSFA